MSAWEATSPRLFMGITVGLALVGLAHVSRALRYVLLLDVEIKQGVNLLPGGLK